MSGKQDQLREGFARNLWVIKQQTKGLNHDDALKQPPFRGNCMNWVLGHLLESRNRVLGLLGQDQNISDQEMARYAAGSEPVVADGPDVISLDELLKRFEQSQERIEAGLRATSDDKMAEVVDTERNSTRDDHVFFLYFHDTYHAGQTELLRQLAGTDDHVI